MNRYPFHADGLVPSAPTINRRTNKLMREHVDLLAWCVDAGEMTAGEAARRMQLVGVPLSVACRVLPKRRRA
jgi:hypothetical protein